MTMAKRLAPEADPKFGQARVAKRQRVENSAERNGQRPNAVVEEVTSARQLQKALVFDQGSASGFRNGLSMLKAFLDSILYEADPDGLLPRKRAILREYLETQKTSGKGDSDVTFLPSFFQAWGFAAETNFDMLLSQVTASLALLLKACASSADLLEYGTLLSKQVLQTSVAKRLNRSLSAPASKENVISPILRLLTEITRFNEGALAKAVYAKRDFTLDARILARNIGLWRDDKDVPVEKRKPSIRTHAVRYFLTHMTYQDELAKTEILSNTNVVRGVFDHIHADSPSLISEIFSTMKDHVFADKAIMRHTKSRILTGKTLSHIASLYRYETSEESVHPGRKAPDEMAHEFLMFVCTSPAYGVMLPSNGYYPPANEDEDGDAILEDAADFANGVTADAVEGTDRVRNIILGEFVQSLRPHASIMQTELIIAIFEACPELVAPYFRQKEAFSYDPKLTSTWIGYSSFLYKVVELPVPQRFGGRRSYKDMPPPVSVVMQSILPQPLTQAVLVKCLNNSSELVNLFAIRILIVAFKKLRDVLEEYATASATRSSQAWEHGGKRLLAEFSQRCPTIKTVIQAYRRPTFQKDMMREAIVRLMRMYFEVTPQVALEEKFDVSVPLCNTLIQAGKPAEAPEEKAFRVLELEHWMQIARQSSSMRWWQKTKSLPHSPFTMLLKLVVTSTEGDLYGGVKALLNDVLRDHDMLQMDTHPDALDVLLASLAPSCGTSAPPEQILDFLDDCCARFIKAPIKYFDDLDALRLQKERQQSNSGPFSSLLMTFVEQWPFKGGKAEKGNPAEPLAQWLSKLLYLAKLVGEDEVLLEGVRDALISSADATYQQVLKDCFLWKMGKEKAKEALKAATGADFSGSERSTASPVPRKQETKAAKDSLVDLELPPQEDQKHAALHRWRKKDLDESIDDGDIGELLLCLCSQHQEIRLQAVSSIRQLMGKIEASEDPDLLQLRLLLGEALETATPNIDSRPFPYVGGVFAARAVSVLADPTHFMFAKLNQFLMKRPQWTVENIPRYFGRNTLTSEPDQDGFYHQEVDWYLDYLIDCLRTPEDMEIFRTKNIFERLLTHYLSPSCSMSTREKIVRLLLRAAAVGGSTTLITRCGLVSWIQMRLQSKDYRHAILRRLASRLWETCDQAKVASWSSGTAEKAIRRISQGT